MSVALENPMSLEDFLDWESRQEFKSEFDGSQPVAMTGVTVAHSVIQANLLGLLFNRLRRQAFRAHGSNLKIQVAGRIRYWVADVLVGEAELTLPGIGSSILLSEVYEGVPFPPEDIPTVSGA